MRHGARSVQGEGAVAAGITQLVCLITLFVEDG